MLAAHEFATDSDKNYLLSRIVGTVTQYEVGQHTAPVGAGSARSPSSSGSGPPARRASR